MRERYIFNLLAAASGTALPLPVVASGIQHCETAARRHAALAAEADGCIRCPLRGQATQVVFADGDPGADLMLVGEGPGAEEDRQGVPFVGVAGQLLNRILEAAEIKPEDIYIVTTQAPKLRTKARFIVIPSTSGTASEITAFSVITDRANHIKYPLVSYEITPDIAIMDPALPAKMPPHITANTGMDVMAHAVEAYVSTNATSYTDPLALEAIRLVLPTAACGVPGAK
jgi:hypothetical protein